jgi:hypothetical protein
MDTKVIKRATRANPVGSVCIFGMIRIYMVRSASYVDVTCELTTLHEVIPRA